MAKQILRIKIKETRGQIKRKINDAIVKRFSRRQVLETAGVFSATKVRKLFLARIRASATYRALSASSALVGELGLEQPHHKIDTIVEQWAESIQIKFNRGRSSNIKGSFRISMVRSNYAEVLRLAEAKQKATSKNKAVSNQVKLRWLELLLKEGDKTIIEGFDVLMKPGLPSSRTGLAIMIGSKKGAGAKSWRVPDGDWKPNIPDDNFVTRVLEAMGPEVLVIMEKELRRAVRRA